MYGAGLAKAVALTPEVIKGDFSVVLHGERGPGKVSLQPTLLPSASRRERALECT